MHRHQTKKSGKDDKDGPWAQARMAQCLMMTHQLEIDQYIVRGDLMGAAALVFQYKGDCERKPCVKQRIASNIARPCHPDCIDALNVLRVYDFQAALQFDADLEDNIDGYLAMVDEVQNRQDVDINIEFNMDNL